MSTPDLERMTTAAVEAAGENGAPYITFEQMKAAVAALDPPSDAALAAACATENLDISWEENMKVAIRAYLAAITKGT